jgi:folate-dependent phosphoribosylglycinamide formyltransferase PurN
MNVAVITPNRIQSRLLINQMIATNNHPTKVFFYTPDKKKIPIWIRALSSVKTLLRSFTVQGRIKRVREKNEKRAIQEFDKFAVKRGIKTVLDASVDYQEIRNLSSAGFVNQMKQEAFDVVFVWGVPILKEELLNTANQYFINAHSSILPQYKGSKSEFWQCYHQAFDHAGITFHKVESGVDTGDILVQVKAKAGDCKTPELLRTKNHLRVIENIDRVFDLLKSGVPFKPQLRSNGKAYRMRDIELQHLKKVYLGLA